MLETIREFASEQVSEDERDRLLHRLLELLLELFEDANLRPHVSGEPRLDLAQEERPNVDVALASATKTGNVRAGLRLMELLEMYWITNDPVGGRERVDALIAVGGDAIEPRVHGEALRLRGATFDMTGRSDLAEPVYVRAIELLRLAGDEQEIAHLTLRIANCAVKQGDIERARQLATEAIDADPPIALGILAQVAFAEKDAARAAGLARQAADAAAAAGQTWWRGVTLLGASEGLLALGELATAQEFFVEGLDLLRSVQDLVNLPIAFAAGAALAARLGDDSRAGTLWGAVEADAARRPRSTTTRAIEEYEPYVEHVRGPEFEEARERGRAMSLEAAAAYALDGQT
jgi:tetratricopeptide (TPR) repeat protein